MTEDDMAMKAWAMRRHQWLWRHAFNRSTWRPLRSVALRAAIAAMKLDVLYWRHLRRQSEGT